MGVPLQPTPMQTPGGFTQPQQGQGGQQQQNKAITVTDWSQVPDGVASRLDPTDDPWAFSAPPPMGKYRLKLFMPRDGIQFKKDRNDQPMFYSNVECRIQHEDKTVANFPLFDWANTSLGRGKNLSTMAGLIRNSGVQLPAEATPKQIAQFFEQWLKSEPVLWAWCDWEGQIEDGENNKGETRYVTKFSSMKDFPEKADGTHEHLVKVTTRNGGFAECRAQLKVKVWGNQQDVAVPHQPIAMQPGFAPMPVGGGFAKAAPQGSPAPAQQQTGGASPFGQTMPAQAPAAPSWGQQTQQTQQQAQPAQQQQTNAAPQAQGGDLNSILRG